MIKKQDPSTLREFLISPDTPLIDTMKIMGATARRGLFVVDTQNRLLGSITDGDIRRALISGHKLSLPISETMFQKPRFIKDTEAINLKKVKKLFLEENLPAIPVLDKSNQVIQILFWQDFLETPLANKISNSQVTNPIVIMAGGKGERLGPLTKILPKPLIPLGDKPILERIMQNFYRNGFRNFMLVLNYKKEFIKSYFNESSHNYNLSFVEENKYLGTAGGLSLLKKNIHDTFIVSNCDIFINLNFQKILKWHKKQKAAITLIGHKKKLSLNYGILETNDVRLKSIVEKPSYDILINTGMYIMEPEVLEAIGDNEFIDMNHLIARVNQEKKVAVYSKCDQWFDLGQWQEYQKNLEFWKEGTFRNISLNHLSNDGPDDA